eukprot:m.154284 g.154284  ORF g.154284 m.154284 type:complete len:207 (-) comp20783_c0_seq6:1360-1980(-)
MAVVPLPWAYVPHKRPLPEDDELFELGNAMRGLGFKRISAKDVDAAVQRVNPLVCHIGKCRKQFFSAYDFETHYNAMHRFKCQQCHRVLPTERLLGLHTSETHDPFFAAMSEKQPMFECLVDTCSEKFKTRTDRKTHLIEIHKFPPDFRFSIVVGKIKSKRGKKSKAQQAPAMEIEENPVDRRVPASFSFGRGGRGRGLYRPRGKR